MFNKVFISYASDDQKIAQELYNFLLSKQYDPWLDKEKLQVGDSWDIKIRQALKSSDFVILLLSSNSINKRGYFQREFKLALKYLEEKLIDDSYIFPVLLDDCEIPDPLKSIQWIKYSELHFFIRILGALDSQRKIYFQTTPQQIIDLKNSYITERLTLLPEIRKYVEGNIEYPVFAPNNFWDTTLVNEAVKAKAVELRNNLYNFYFDDPSYFRFEGIGRTFEVNYSISSITETHLSILLTLDQFLGGAHSNISFHSLNFIFNPTYLIEPKGHFEHSEIKEIVSSKLYSDSLESEDINNCGDLSSFVEDYNYNLEFTVHDNRIELILANNLPHVMLICGFFSVPFYIWNHKFNLQLPIKP